MMKQRLVAGAALTLAGVLALGQSLGSAAGGPPWSTFHATFTRSGVSAVNGPTDKTAANDWSVARGFESSPVVDANDTAYIGNDDGRVYSFKPSEPRATGLYFQTGGAVVATPTLSSDGSTLYVASTDGNLYALKTADMSKIWATPLGGFLTASPLLSGDGKSLYMPIAFGGFKTVDTATGKITATTAINGSIPGSLAESPDGSIIYVGTNNDQLYGAATPSTGGATQLSPFYLAGEALATPAVDSNGNIYVTTSVGSLDSFAPANSAARWSFQTALRKPSNSTPAVYNGNVYFGDADGNLYAVNASNGQQVWQAHTGGNVGSSPAVASGNGIVYVGSEDGNVYAFNAASGALLWDRPIGSAITSSPALGPDGSLWVASRGGRVLRIADLGSVPAQPGTPQPATPTTQPTSTGPQPTATTSPTVVTTTTPGTATKITLKSKVAAGTKQVIKITTAPNVVVRIRVNYPNGDHQSHRATSNASGKVTYKYTQGASKIRHNRKYASVVVRLADGTTVTKQYKILAGRIDASVEPRTQSPRKFITIWVHTSRYTRVQSFLLFPNGAYRQLNGRTGPKGWAQLRYRVGTGLTRGRNHKVHVLARVAAHANVSTKTTFTIR